MRMYLLMLSCLAIAACDVVTMDSPPGNPVTLKAEDWNGLWLHEEGTIRLLVDEAEQGRLEAAWLEERGGSLVTETLRGQLRQAGDWHFAIMRQEEKQEGDGEAPDRYLFGRLVMERNRLLLWTPSPAAFREAVEAGTLPGRVVDGNVLLETLNETQIAQLIAEGARLFDWEQPVVLIRLQP